MTYGVTFELRSEYTENPRLTQLEVKQFQTCIISKSKRKEESIPFLKCTPNYSLWEWKHNEIKVVEKYCSVVIQLEEWPCLSRSGSSVLEFGFQLELACICIYSWPYVYWVLTRPNLTCTRTSSTQPFSKSGSLYMYWQAINEYIKQNIHANC